MYFQGFLLGLQSDIKSTTLIRPLSIFSIFELGKLRTYPLYFDKFSYICGIKKESWKKNSM